MALAPSESLEWSLPVPSVQELAIQRLDKLPLRYVRDDLDQITPSNPSLRVPLIDMNKLVNPEFREKELQKLRFACQEWGVFQVINTENIRQYFFFVVVSSSYNTRTLGTIYCFSFIFLHHLSMPVYGFCSSYTNETLPIDQNSPSIIALSLSSSLIFILQIIY